MRSKRKPAIQAVLALLAAILTCGLLSCRAGPSSLRGAVLERNSDPRKESPIADVEVIALVGSTSSSARTDSSGYFTIPLRRWIRRGQSIRLAFRHPGYQSLDLNEAVGDKLYIVHMAPVPSGGQSKTKRPITSIANVKIRYSMKTTASVNVGSAVKTFEVINTGNLPCNGHRPCSPDGKWKAAVGSTTLDAGEGNEFRNARLSCIAGPCPFTKVESDGYSEGGKKITASVLNWSDTTTFLLEAEVYHPIGSEVIQEFYPVIFGQALNFSVPSTGEGVSLEADVNGDVLVFPLGPSLCLSWAKCTVATDKDHSKSYRCELKDGYDFR
ncbi:MAG: carboxypeptidase-like regulatory domain-containing protein [Acidobacteriia bacterium]|nr:carboxypeptidase-like regulatory domain-containing protein [Terriglobia bacterium]